MGKKKEPATADSFLYVCELVVLHPILNLGLSQAQNVLVGVDGSFAATDMQEVQTLGSLVQILFVTGGIAQLTAGISLDQSCSLGVILLLADDLLHDMVLLSRKLNIAVIIHIFIRKSSAIS